jgi:hypothetical protein
MAKDDAQKGPENMDILRFIYALGNSGVFLDHNNFYFGDDLIGPCAISDFNTGGILDIDTNKYSPTKTCDYLKMTTDMGKPRTYANARAIDFPLKSFPSPYYLHLPLSHKDEACYVHISQKDLDNMAKPELLMKIVENGVVEKAAIVVRTNAVPARFSNLIDFLRYCLPKKSDKPDIFVPWNFVLEHDSTLASPRILMCHRIKPLVDSVEYGREYVSLYPLESPVVENLLERLRFTYAHMKNDSNLSFKF